MRSERLRSLSEGPETSVRPISLSEARVARPIPSSFETSRVLRCMRSAEGQRLAWQLEDVQLEQAFRKTYDLGDVNELLDLYSDSVPEDRMKCLAAFQRELVGLLYWTYLAWNNTIWLIDVRVRPGARRGGVASALVERLKKSVDEYGARGISVETQTNNWPAIQFYRSNGFSLVGLNEVLYTNSDLADQDVACFLFYAVER